MCQLSATRTSNQKHTLCPLSMLKSVLYAVTPLLYAHVLPVQTFFGVVCPPYTHLAVWINGTTTYLHCRVSLCAQLPNPLAEHELHVNLLTKFNRLLLGYVPCQQSAVSPFLLLHLQACLLSLCSAHATTKQLVAESYVDLYRLHLQACSHSCSSHTPCPVGTHKISMTTNGGSVTARDFAWPYPCQIHVVFKNSTSVAIPCLCTLPSCTCIIVTNVF